jgi:prolyl-tRNA editing enzyme YbaK/EbsC (Cys-tRNA(Pro) deacylase)
MPVVDWPEPVARVSAFLRESGAEARIEEFSEGTPTAQAAADAVGCELARIVKSLVFLCDGRPLVALVPGDRRGDPRKIAAAAGAHRAHVAGPELVREATGFEPGAVSPFPLPRIDRILVDGMLLTHDVVWVGAGSDRHMAGLSPAELVRLTRAQPADLVTDDPG